MKLFKNNVPEIEHELTNLEQEKAQLSQKFSTLSAKARTTEYMPEKEKVIEQKGEIYTKMSQLQSNIDVLKEKLALSKIEALLQENRQDILLYCNNDNRIRIQENLIVEIPFSCGKHPLKMPIYEILRFQTTLEGNVRLREHWKTIINGKETRTRQLLCPQCMKERKEHAQKEHRISNQRTGIALIKIQVV